MIIRHFPLNVFILGSKDANLVNYAEFQSIALKFISKISLGVVLVLLWVNAKCKKTKLLVSFLGLDMQARRLAFGAR